MNHRKQKSNSDKHTLSGTVDHVNRKYAFIEIDEFSEDIKVRSRYLKGDIHGDKVEVKIFHHLSRRNLEGEVVKITSRGNTEFIGTIEDCRGLRFSYQKIGKYLLIFLLERKSLKNIQTKKNTM